MTKKTLKLKKTTEDFCENALDSLLRAIPYSKFLGIHLDRQDGELITVLPFSKILIGNPNPPALHGGAIAAFLEITAVVELIGRQLSKNFQYSGAKNPPKFGKNSLRIPKTIDFTVNYLRPGITKAAYAQAKVNRTGRRYGTVFVEAWQVDREKIFTQPL